MLTEWDCHWQQEVLALHIYGLQSETQHKYWKQI